MLTLRNYLQQAANILTVPTFIISVLTFTATAHAQPPVSPDWSSPATFSDTPTTGTSPRIATNGSRWITIFSGPYLNSGDTELMASMSDDGIIWTAPQPLNADSATDSTNEQDLAIAAGDNGVWLCMYRRDGALYLIRSLDNGATWLPPVFFANASAPSIAYLGSSQWMVAFGPAINVLKSTDDGADWHYLTTLPGSISKGACGNTSPCATQSLSNPVVAGSPISGIVIVGFDVHTFDRPSGYTGPSYSYDSVGGFRSDDKGETFPDAAPGYPYYTNIYFEGNNTIKVTGPSEYLVATGNFFHKAYDRYEGEPGVTHPASAISTSTRLAASRIGHAMGLSINTHSGESGTTTGLIATLSTDFGTTWEPTHTIDTTSATTHGDIKFAALESTPAGQFITVYQVTDTHGNSTIWYSRLDRFIVDTDADGVPDENDVCPGTPEGDIVDSEGCTITDLDNDGVLNEVDQCPDTPEGDIVDAHGCSILQNCPCEGPREGGLYKNKKGQKKCFKQHAKQLVKEKRMTKKERKALLKQYKTISCEPPVSR